MLGEAGSAPNPYAWDRELGAPPPVPQSLWGPLPPESAHHIANLIGLPRGLASRAVVGERCTLPLPSPPLSVSQTPSIHAFACCP